MEFRLLGPVGLWLADREVDVGPPRQRCVLAVLLSSDRPVPTATLIDRVWGEDPPDRVRDILYTYVARLRIPLRSAAIELRHRAGAYRLMVDDNAVDLRRFGRLTEEARAEPDEAARVSTYRRALAIWRGQALDRLTGDWVNRTRERLDRQRLGVLIECLDLELRLGRHHALIDELSDLVAHHPTVEPFAGYLMRALYRAGRQAEALRVYRGAWTVLADHGLEPGPELRELEHAILANEPALRPPAITSVTRDPTEPARPWPHQLPAEPGGFVGRVNEIRLLERVHEGQLSGARIAAIVGPAGVGKTTLAVHWANQIADQYPDGELYVNLRGFDPRGPILDPAEAIRGFLDAFLVRPEQIPGTPDARASLYRSLLAGRRILIVLDNARDAEHVRPLLPGSPDCLILVTSRNHLVGLVAAEAAQSVILDVLSDSEARDMLTNRLGHARVADDSYAADGIVSMCARLPLALAIVAARAATQPDLPLARLVEHLGRTRSRLSAFDTGDPATDILAVFSWSYDTLTSESARLLRLTGIHPGPDYTMPALASLANRSAREVEQLLTELASVHLITEPTLGRYAMHDLVHAYAAELTQTLDSSDDRQAALRRLLDQYLHTAYAAGKLLAPFSLSITLPSIAPGVTPEHLADLTTARVWFAAEYPVLSALLRTADGAGFDTHAWQLAASLVTFLDRAGLWQDAMENWHVVLDAAERRADRDLQAETHRYVADGYSRLAQYDKAHHHYRRAIDLHQERNDQSGQGHAHLRLSAALDQQGNHSEALHHAERAVDLFRATGSGRWLAYALNTVGWCHAQLGDHAQALSLCQLALDLHEQGGDRHGQAAAWDSIGLARQNLGHHPQAIASYDRAVEIFNDIGEHRWEAEALIRLGDAHDAAGHHDAARDIWRRALSVLDGFGHPEAVATARARLGLSANDPHHDR